MDKYIWVRCGDQDDYHQFDSVREGGEYLKEMRVTRPAVRYESGVSAPGYNGQNYISFFWGNEDGTELVDRLDDEEIEIINEEIEDTYVDVDL